MAGDVPKRGSATATSIQPKESQQGYGGVRVLDLGGLVKVLAFDDDWWVWKTFHNISTEDD